MAGDERAPSAPPARQGGLRRHNLSLVLREVLEAPAPPARADVSARTGLTRAAVSALVDRLVAAGMVAELAPVMTRRAGRPAVPLVAAAGTFAAIGLEVNVSYLGARAIDLAGNPLAERLRRDDFRQSAPGAVLDLLASLTDDVLADVRAQGARVVGAGLALPGLVDRDAGKLLLAPNLGWRDVELADMLRRAPFDSLGAVELGNEANLAAWSEVAAHPHSRPSFVYVSGEVGIGGALVHEGRVFQGLRGWSGELGHTTVEPDGPRCACGGQGCLEQYAGKAALMTAAGLDPVQPVEHLVARLGESGTARAAVQRAAWALGIALANVINVVDVDEVVLGGLYAPLAGPLEPGITEQLGRRVLSSRWSSPTVRAVDDGEHAAMTGAALSVLRRLVDDPTAWGASSDGDRGLSARLG